MVTINGNITSAARCNSIITNYKNAESLLSQDSNFKLLLSPALPNHRSILENISNSAASLIKPVHTNKFDIHRRLGTKNLHNPAVCVCYLNVSNSHSPLAAHNHNFNVDAQHVSVFSCGRTRSESCFHNRVNGVKNSKTARGLSVGKVECKSQTSSQIYVY